MTHRIYHRWDAEPISEALRLIPAPITTRLAHVRYVAGVDPIFAGLHDFEDTHDGRSYRGTAHACWPEHLSRLPRAERVTTVVLPEAVTPHIVVHELGHALDHALCFDTPTPDPVTQYAQTNCYEAFAEAFTAWVMPEVYPWAGDILAQDKETLEFFEGLLA